MTSVTDPISAASATPSDTAATEQPHDFWLLGLLPVLIFSLIFVYYFVLWLYDKVDRSVKEHRRIKRQEVEMRKRRLDWELYP